MRKEGKYFQMKKFPKLNKLKKLRLRIEHQKYRKTHFFKKTTRQSIRVIILKVEYRI